MLTRGAMVLAFLGYILMNAMGAWSWAQLKWVRAQDLTRLDALFKEGAPNHDYSKAETWIRYRPLAETPQIIAKAEPYMSWLSPFTFFDFSDRADRRGDAAEADFWNTVAHFRLRFDLLRCGLPHSVEDGRRLIDVFATINNKYYRDIPDEPRHALARRAMEFDDRHPAADDPESLCRLIAASRDEKYSILARDKWEAYRLGMHESAALTLKGPLKIPLMPDKKQGKNSTKAGDKKKMP
jgi:hypothetical protein